MYTAVWTNSEVMVPILFDSSIYIRLLRAPLDAASEIRRLAEGEPVWLSSVVLEELYAGASTRDRRVVERFERDFTRASRVLVPNLSDWSQTGKVIALISARYNFEKIARSRLTNDALIAMSARRMGVTVITANTRDFGKLAEFRPFHWKVNRPAN